EPDPAEAQIQRAAEPGGGVPRPYFGEDRAADSTVTAARRAGQRRPAQPGADPVQPEATLVDPAHAAVQQRAVARIAQRHLDDQGCPGSAGDLQARQVEAFAEAHVSIEVLGTRESTTHQAGRPGGHSKRCSKSPARHGLPSIQWVEIPSYLSSEEGLRCDRDHGEYFLPAGFCPFLDERSELRLAAHLAPELGEAGPAAAAPQT